jgi:molybdopterin molybdotransferase
MRKAPEMIRPEEAWQRIAAALPALPAESVSRRDAVGRVLAESLFATVDVPAVDVSAMDGFAIGRDCFPGQISPIQGTIAAGARPGAELAPDSAYRIMTGAPIPGGADRVVPVELTRPAATNSVEIVQTETAGSHIRRQGEVLQRGMALLASGTPLTPGALALLATHGHQMLSVHRRPRVAILATGDEVVAPEMQPEPGQLRDSHTDFLLAAGQGLGLTFESLGIAPDRQDIMRSKIGQGIGFDVLLVGGGVSMGEFDFVEEILTDLGCEVLFEAVAVQPGKPLVAARHKRGLVFGLPGNPASVMVGFWLFVRPTLRCLQGITDGFWYGALTGELASPLPGAKGRDRFLPALVRATSGTLLVEPRLARGSHDVDAFAHGSALVRIPAGAEPAEPGETCEILPFANWPSWSG